MPRGHAAVPEILSNPDPVASPSVFARDHAHTLTGPDVARQVSIAISCTILHDEQMSTCS